MPYCPHCGTEYRPGITRCPDCDQELLDDLAEENYDGDPDDEDYFESNSESVLLCQTNDVVSAELLEEALKENGIPFLEKAGTGLYSGFGSISQVMKGVKIYVPESALDRAIEIAETIIPDFQSPEI
jgi:hypothetical protein